MRKPIQQICSEIREFWDVSGIITHDSNPVKEWNAYKEAYEHNFEAQNGPIENSRIQYEDFDRYIEYLKEAYFENLNQKEKPMSYTQYFEQKSRPNGDRFICKTDACPQNLKDLIFSIHLKHFFGALPNDWIYETIYEAFEELEETNNDINDINIEGDYAYRELYEWLGNSYSHEYCNEVLQEGLITNPQDIYAIISCAEVIAKARIYQAVSEFITENQGD